ncbi:MAG: hypothetical protein EKK48_06700 [Candidatus Melainabacteria bacterium]|nr:MAG: hypothetical protein EKK48_06700 [Candidatus Melainabacteria bacterium]
MQANDFGFGIEAEFLIVDNQSYTPLSYRSLNFQTLLALVDSIPTADCSREGFNKKPLHNLISPYLIEGYTLTDAQMKPLSLLPKGVEIRTPLADSFEQSTETLNNLYRRLKTRLIESKLNAAMISYHPTEQRIDAPANYKRHDYWQWALTATTTYGPDINISLPNQLEEEVNIERINARVNYYAPAAIALTLASPIRDGALWSVDGRIGKSVRTFERSKWAPIFYVHEKPSLRFEFKGFEMSNNLNDYHAMFLIGLALLLDDGLTGEESDSNRISELEAIAFDGLATESVREKAAQILESAETIARRFSLNSSSLKTFWNRLKKQHLPADDIADTFRKTGSIEQTLRTLTDFDSRCQSGNNSNKTVCLA